MSLTIVPRNSLLRLPENAVEDFTQQGKSIQANGRTYQILSSFNRPLTLLERINHICLAIFAVILSLGTLLFFSPIRELFWKTQDDKKFIVTEKNGTNLTALFDEVANQTTLFANTPNEINPTHDSTQKAYTYHEIEKTFWEDHFDPKKTPSRFLQMAMFKNLEEDPFNFEAFVDKIFINYCDFLAHHHSALLPSVIDKEEKIKASVILNLKMKFHLAKVLNLKERSQAKLNNGDSIKIFRTKGDGACGFHALLGKVNGDKIEIANISAMRKDFCKYLSEQHLLGLLPHSIVNVIDDYFLNFAYAPATFQRTVKEVHTKLFASYPKTSPLNSLSEKKEIIARQEKIKREFLEHPVVFKAYLKEMKQVKSYLLRDELQAVADWQKISVYLCQPEFLQQELIGCDLLNPGHKQHAYVFYNGINHYEMAELI